MARNRQQIPKADRQAEVLSHARQLFVAKGYRATSVTQVGKAAGIASAAALVLPHQRRSFSLPCSARSSTRLVLTSRISTSHPRRKWSGFLRPPRLTGSFTARRTKEWPNPKGCARCTPRRPSGWSANCCCRWNSDCLLGTTTAAIADVAHVLFEGLLVSQRDLDRPDR